MLDAFAIDSPSPNTQHVAHFAMSGEIRFGPLYYSLSIDGYAFGRRIFGSAHLWSPSSTLLAVQEWLTLDYSEGPITALVLIDVQHKREATVARATKRFLVPETFAGTQLVYRTEQAGNTDSPPVEVDTSMITEWAMLG